jgi:hypothetical protein
VGEKWPVKLACDSDFHVNRRHLLHAANLQHGTDGFTSPPKEGALWIFSPKKSDGFGRVRTRNQRYGVVLWGNGASVCPTKMVRIFLSDQKLWESFQPASHPHCC